MSTQTQQDPILVLYELERRSRGHAFGLPEQDEAKEAWHGIGFRLGNFNFVAPLGQVGEILVSPVISRVPGAKRWVAGIANVRGTLLPVLDLRGFLNQGPSEGRRRRTLVVEHGAISAALLVDDVAGLKHFFDEERTTNLPPMPANVLAYVSGAFEQGGQLWVVFDMHRLVLDPEFMQVAA